MTMYGQSTPSPTLHSSREGHAPVNNPLQIKTKQCLSDYLATVKILMRDGTIISDLYGPLQQLMDGKVSLEKFNQRLQNDLQSSSQSMPVPLLTMECLKELREGLIEGRILFDKLPSPLPATPVSPGRFPTSYWATVARQCHRISWISWTVLALLLSVGIPAFHYFHIHEETTTAPPCNISSSEVLSAISRAKTNFCKIKLAEFGCLLQNESVYPKSLPNFCPEEKPVTDMSDRRNAVRILFVLTVHGRDSRQVRRLIRLIYREDHYLIIHVDRRSDFLFKELLPLEIVLPNLKLLRTRHAPIWGGASLLSTLLDAMRFGLEQTDWQDWDYFLNLSESDLPIKSNDELVEYLASNFGHNFVKSHGTPAETFIKRQGLDKSFFECEDHMWRMGGRHLPSGIIVDGGSDWVALHRGFCQYLQNDAQSELLVGLRTVFNHTLLPAESFFHTVLLNSQFCHSFINNNLRLTNWRRKKGCKCQYKHIVDWCGCSPNVFREADLKKISNYAPRPVFFARKFDPFVDLKIINRVLSERSGTQISKNRDLSVDEVSAVWKRHWLNLHSSGDFHSSPVTEVLFESLKRLSARAVIESPSDGELGKLLGVHVTVDLHGKRNLLLVQETEEETGQMITFESFVGFIDQFKRDPRHLIVENSPVHRILNIQVSTDFDQKEEIFRNYPLAHGPFCDPALAYNVSAGEAVMLSVVWLDPADVVAGSFELSLAADSDVGLHQPQFKKPLRPGVWSVHLMHKWKSIAYTRFLVLPHPTPGLDNLGPQGSFYIDHNFTSVAELFEPALRPAKKKATADENGRKNPSDLSAWADELVMDFYTIEDFCFVADRQADLISASPSQAKLCRETAWSSFFPDDSQIFAKIPAN